MAYNNVLYRNTGHGITVGSGGNNARIYNNTVYGGLETGIYIQSACSGAVVQNNIAYGNRTAQILSEGASATLSHNFTSNPNFANVAAFDFNLQSTSPAIDAGVFLSQVTTDIRNRIRPQGSNHDIGAYEAGLSSAPAPPRNLNVR
jgi:parallel beta-helix repeat protein